MCVSLWWYINAQSETCQRAVSFAFNVLPLTQSKNFVSVSQCLSAERTCRKGCQIEATIRLGGTKKNHQGI